VFFISSTTTERKTQKQASDMKEASPEAGGEEESRALVEGLRNVRRHLSKEACKKPLLASQKRRKNSYKQGEQ
jgi:hypothetical protein